MLSSLYTVGILAYIGGAFTTGVHNVMEPSVMGLPVLFGPKHYNSPEAVDLLKRGFAFAAQVIESQAGAADQCFQLITKNCNYSETTTD